MKINEYVEINKQRKHLSRIIWVKLMIFASHIYAPLETVKTAECKNPSRKIITRNIVVAVYSWKFSATQHRERIASRQRLPSDLKKLKRLYSLFYDFKSQQTINSHTVQTGLSEFRATWLNVGHFTKTERET